MAANTDASNLMQYLRSTFPQISDDVIWRVMTQNPNDLNACKTALQNEQHLRYGLGQRGSLSVDLRDRNNANGMQQSQTQKHRYSEPNVLYQRNISEASIHLEPQQRPVSAPPDKSMFTVQYPLQHGNQTPAYVPYSGPYHNRSAPAPVRSYSTTASLVMNQPDRHSPVPWSDPPPRYAPNDGHQHNVGSTTQLRYIPNDGYQYNPTSQPPRYVPNDPYNISPTNQPHENTVTSSIQYRRPNNIPVTPTSSRPAVLQHANTSPMLGRRLYHGKQLKEILMSTPNDLGLGTPAPIKPMMSPASSVSSLTDSPEVKQEINHPLLPITKEQEEYAYTQALLLHQRMRYQRLNQDYEDEKAVLEMLKREVDQMERQLSEKRANKSTQCTAKTITRLSEENRQLTIDIECMTREIEINKNQGKYKEGFYENIETGASGPVKLGHPDPRAILPRYEVPLVKEDEDGYLLVMEPDEDQQWVCRLCTFLNHPALSVCETCERPRSGQAYDAQ